jgi:hypothetical protein
MSRGDDEQENPERELAKLRAELVHLKASIPAHSMKVSLMLRIEELEEEIERIERQAQSK